MNNKEIFKKVGGIISELNEQYEYLSQSPDHLNELELELFSANANFLSDHISILVKINDKIKATAQVPAGLQPVPEKKETVPDKVVENIPEVSPVTDSGGLNFEFERNSGSGEASADEAEEAVPQAEDVPQAIAEEHPEEDTDTPVEEDSPADVVKEVIISERTVTLDPEQLVNDKPAVPLTVNELLSRSRQQETMGSRLNLKQPKDLKSMVSLNDKLLFVRDLFNGYSLAYSEAIELLNRFDSMEAAENFLKQNYAVKNSWIDKAEVANKFYEILSRRFSK